MAVERTTLITKKGAILPDDLHLQASKMLLLLLLHKHLRASVGDFFLGRRVEQKQLPFSRLVIRHGAAVFDTVCAFG